MSNHTPGPWVFGIRCYDEECKLGFVEKPFDYVSPGYHDNAGIFGPNGTEIVGCDEYSIFNSPADARLIAAAPDLLFMLVEAANFIQPYSVGQELLERIDAAIAKATGEKP